MDDLIYLIIVLAIIFIVALGLSWIEYRLRKSEPFIGLILEGVVLLTYILFSKGMHTSLLSQLFVCIVAILPIIIARYVVHDKYKSIVQEHNQKLQRQQTSQMVQKYKSDRAELVAKYGQPTKSITIWPYNLSSDIDLFEERQILKLGDRFLSFKDIMGHHVLNERDIEKGTQYSNSTFSGNYNGRSTSWDGLVYGHGDHHGKFSGQIKGTVTSGNDHVREDITIAIQTDSLSEPTIFYHIGEDKRLAQEVLDILEIIERRNRQSATR